MSQSRNGEDPIERSLTIAAVVAGMAAALMGAGYLIAWLSGGMTNLGLHAITIKTNASLCLVFCGSALALTVPQPVVPSRRLICITLATLALLIGGLTLLEHLFRWNLGIDQILARESNGALGVTNPNRMGPPAAASFTICAVALLLLQGRKAAVRTAQVLGIVLCLIALLGMLGYAYGVQGLYGFSRYTAIAWQTTVAILLLGLGILFARPRSGLMATVTARDPGGVAIRTLLLPAVVIPALLGWLRLQGEWLGLYEPYFGTSILVLSWMVIFSFLVFLTGKRLSSAAAARDKVTEELQLQRQLLETVVKYLPAGVLIVRGSDLRVLLVNPAYALFASGLEMLNKTLGEIWPDIEPDLDNLFRQVAKSGEPYHAVDQPFLIRRAPDQPLELRSFTWSLYPVQLPGDVGLGLLCTVWETSDRKRTEEALRQSETRLRNIIENMADGLVVIDPESGALLWNKKALEMHDATGEEDDLASAGSLSINYEMLTLSGELVPAEQWPVPRLMRGEELGDLDLVVRDKVRNWQRVFSYSGRLVRDSDGNPRMGVLNLRDITETKRSQEALRESEELLRTVLENLPVGVWILDRDGHIAHANKAAQEIWRGIRYVGIERFGEYQGWWLDTGRPVEHEEWGGARALTKGETTLNMEVEIEAFDGSRKIISDSAVPIRNLKGEITGAITINQDITARKKAEHALRESEKKFRAIFQLAAVGIGRVRFRDACWIDVNDAFCRMLGYSADEMLAIPWPKITHPDDLDLDLIPFREMAAGKLDSYSVEKRFIHKDGHHVWARLALALVRTPEGDADYEIAVIEDITYRKQAEEALRKAKDELELRVRERTRELEQAYENLTRETEERIAAVENLRRSEQLLIQQSRMAAMGEMLGNIAHQWRQPLNILGLLIQQLLLTFEPGRLTREHLEAEVAKAMRVILHMSHTINDFRDFLQEDREKKPFSVNHAIATTVSLLDAGLKSMDVELELKESEELFVNGHRNEFSQVVMNIITNARDAFRERNIRSPKITISLFQEKGRAVITIVDNAGGIDEEIIAKVFDPYFTTKGPDKGTGIGLFMSKNIIEKSMGGALTVRNVGEGAEFRIELSL